MGTQRPSKRIFVGVKATPSVTDAITQFQKTLSTLPVRLIPPEDMHITLVAPWETDDVASVQECMRVALRGVKRFDIVLDHISYGPTMRNPRLVWASGAATEDFVALKSLLHDTLRRTDEYAATPTPHLTIARLSEEDRRSVIRYPINEVISLTVPVDSVELFLSPVGGGRGYQVLDSFPFSA